MTKLLGIATILTGMATALTAGVSIGAPEIDATTGVAALTLLAGGILVIRARRKK